ncbi:MAG: hypothetical protein JKX88_04360 [Marinicaulis sp.]|nr:hypothetical protein [Marinicaulis sp.]
MQRVKLTALYRGSAAIFLTAQLMISPALGDEQGQVELANGAPDTATTATENSTVIYDSDYFAPFGPVTLEDMIRNIPGARISLCVKL